MDLENKKATRESYGEALLDLGKKNENVVVFDADLSGATKTNTFAKEIKDRFFNIGIAEQDMVSTAAGISTCGKIPYASSFAVFLAGRAYDQVRNAVCYPNLNVKLCATHAGITVGEDGATHQMLEDVSLMRGLPNMRVFCPADETETRWIIEEISKIALENNAKRIDWVCLDWNEPSLEFYKKIGAEKLDCWVLHRLNEENIKKLAE